MIGQLKMRTLYRVRCHDRNGKLKWETEFHNIVVNAGLNKLLDATFVTGLTSPAWYIGLKGTGTPLAADIMSSHSSWADIVPYSNGTRPAFVPAATAVGVVDNSASLASFTINATATVFGCFLTSNATKSGTTGTLYGVGDFGASNAVISTDILTVLISLGVS